MRKDTVLSEYLDAKRKGFQDKEFFEKFDSSNTAMPRITVITRYNSKSYQIDGMTNEYTPATYKFLVKNRETKESKEFRMDEYFYNQYKIKLDSNQPLLFVNRAEGEKIYLPA